MNNNSQLTTTTISISFEINVIVNSLLLTISLLGVFGNALISHAICTNRFLRTTMNANLVSMAFADLTVCLILIPVRINLYAFSYGLATVTWLCRVDVFLKTSLDTAQLFILVSTSFERYQSVANPFDKDGKVRRTCVTLVTAWFSALSVGLLCCLSFGDGGTYYPCYSEHSIFPSQWGVKEKFITLPIGIICIVSVIVFYVLIIKLLKEHRSEMQSTLKKKFNNKVVPNIDNGNTAIYEIMSSRVKPPTHTNQRKAADVHVRPVMRLDDDKEDSGYMETMDNGVDNAGDNMDLVQQGGGGRCGKSFQEHKQRVMGSGTECRRHEHTMAADPASMQTVASPYSTLNYAATQPCNKTQDTPTVQRLNSDNGNCRKLSINQTKRYIIRPDRTSISTRGQVECNQNGCNGSRTTDGKFYRAAFNLMQNIRESSEIKRTSISIIDITASTAECKQDFEKVNRQIPLTYGDTEASTSGLHTSLPTTINSHQTEPNICGSSHENKLIQIPTPTVPLLPITDNCRKDSINDANVVDGQLTTLSERTQIVASDNNQNDHHAAQQPSQPETTQTAVDSTNVNEKKKTIDIVEMNGTVVSDVKVDGAVVGAVCIMNRPNKERGRRKVESRAAKRISLLMGTFILLWFPSPVAVIYISSKRQIRPADVEVILLTAVISTLTVVLNPLLNLALNKQMRSVAFNTLRHCIDVLSNRN